ncbi:hypothetical protein [Cochleicola gelatinilyticus]|uniref:Uncharacterized protein n=1 Tax=Cochleicola gelatinilyticus TaxID=1763537 RepID=A0A167HFW8_9FLAO|nr:hypothetical protein [Cochleicola gelatinilyticus]OAB78566.1 hypothetical protein ULVI_08230 [Cochleicola gelatinilyticus]
MNYFKQVLNENKYNHHYLFHGPSRDELAKKIDTVFHTSGYTTSAGSHGDLVYTKGDKTLRMLLGALVAYYTFRVITTEKENDTYEVEL